MIEWLVCVVSGALLLAMVWWQLRAQFQREVEAERAQHEKELNRFSVELSEIMTQVVDLNAEKERYQRLAETHIRLNETFEQQSKDAWNRYRVAGLAAGNAQAWLLRELNRVVRKLNQLEKEKQLLPTNIDANLAPLIEEFKQEHVS